MFNAFSITRRQALAGIGAAAALSGLSGPDALAADPTPVRVGYVPVIGASAFYVLDKSGAAKAAGLNIASTKFDSGPAAITALASGTLDILAVGVAPVAVAFSRGIDVRVFAAGGVGGSLFLAGGPLAEAFATAGGDPAKAFAAFRKSRGKAARIGALPPGAVPTTAFLYWLKQNKVEKADVDVVTMGIEATQQAMLAGAIDGGQVLEPAATIVQQRIPTAKVIATAPQMFPDAPGVVYAVTGDFLRKHPAAVETFMRLTADATTLIRTHPKTAAPYVQQALGSGLIDVSVLETSLASPAISFVIDPRAIVKTTQDMLDFQVELGDFKTAPKIEGLFDFGPWDRLAKK